VQLQSTVTHQAELVSSADDNVDMSLFVNDCSYFNLWSGDWLLAGVCLQATDAVLVWCTRRRPIYSPPPQQQQRVGAVLRALRGAKVGFTHQTSVAVSL